MGERRKGVIVVNGERLTAPQAREKPYSDLLVNACTNFGYALLSGETLFTLVTYALEESALDDPDAGILAAIRDTILSSDGLVLVEEADEDADEDLDDVDEDGDGDLDEAEDEDGAEIAEPDAASDAPAVESPQAVTADSESGG